MNNFDIILDQKCRQNEVGEERKKIIYRTGIFTTFFGG